MNTDVHRPRKEKDAVVPGVTVYRQGRDGSWEGHSRDWDMSLQ